MHFACKKVHFKRSGLRIIMLVLNLQPITNLTTMKTFYAALLMLFISFHVYAQTDGQEIILETHPPTAPGIQQMDINADGNPEFLYIRENELLVYENDGGSEWSNNYNINKTATFKISKLINADINNDGFEDIIYLSAIAPNKITILINPTDNTDTWETVTLEPGARTLVGVFDVNNDGWKEIIYESFGLKSYYIKNDAGSLEESLLLYDAGHYISYSSTDDVDQDGDTDMIFHFNFWEIKYLRNNADGTVTLSTIGTTFYDHQLSMADIDNDSYSDVIIRNGFAFKIALYNPFTMLFIAPYDLGSYTADDYDFADMDNDGDQDLLLTKHLDDNGSNIYMVENLPDTYFGGETLLADSIEIKDSPVSFFKYNLDDEYVDLFGFINGNTHTFLNDAGTAFVDTAINPDLNFLRIDLIRMLDVNNDGNDEIIVANHDASIAWINYNQTTDTIGSVGKFGKITGSPYPKQMEVTDLNNDTYSDVVVSYQGFSEEEQISYYFMNNGTGNFTPHFIADLAFAEIFFLDVNEDGDFDLVGKEMEYPNALKYYENTGDTSDLFIYNSILCGVGMLDYSLSDVDGDGDMDFLSTKSYDTHIQFIKNINPGLFAAAVDYLDHECDFTPYNVYSDDADGDSDVDIYYTCYGGSSYFAENVDGVYTHTAIGNFEYSTDFDSEYNDEKDINNDGFVDLIFSDGIYNSTHVKLTGGEAFPDDEYITITPDYAIFTDYDQNGITDYIGTNNYSLYVVYDAVITMPEINVITPVNGYLVEGAGIDSVLIFAETTPQVDLIVPFYPGAMVDAGAGVGNPIYLSFAADETALDTQVIYITVPDDTIVEDIFTNIFKITSEDPSWGIYYNIYEADYPLPIYDNELGVFTDGITTVGYEAGAAADINFHINMIPATDVSVSFTYGPNLVLVGDDTLLLGAGYEATLPTTSWFTFPNDFYIEPTYYEPVTITLQSDDPIFNDYTALLTTIILYDNDEAEFYVSPNPTPYYTEGVETFVISLRPLTGYEEPITVTATPDADLDLGAGAGIPVSITFEPSEGIPALGMLSGIPVDDGLVEGNENAYVDFSVSSANLDYDGLNIIHVRIKVDDINEVGIAETDTQNPVVLYPQIGNGKTLVSWDASLNVNKIVVINNLGQHILSSTIADAQQHQLKIDAPAGLYKIIVYTESTKYTMEYLLSK
jgi:hypothetical protein